MTRHTINGLSYYVEDKGAGVPVVMLHGFTGSTDTWQPFMGVIAERYRAIAIDLPGHGRTDAPPEIDRYRMERVVDDLAILLQRLGTTPGNWLGYSMGGRMALYMASRHPQLVRSLILESASPGIADSDERTSRRDQDNTLALRIENEGIERFVNYWENLQLFSTQKRLPEKTRVALRDQRLNNSTTGLANSLRGMGSGVQPELWSELGNLTMPILLIAGINDEKFVGINRQMAAAMATARLKIVPGAGHAVHLEDAENFRNLVMGFLTSLSENDSQYLTHAEEDDKYERSQ